MVEMVEGKVVQVIGSTLDAEYPKGQLPEIYDALVVDIELGGDARRLTCEVQQHLGGNRVRAVALGYQRVPYSWGGTSPQQGFDCSGLTMAVFKLNGMKLPRSSKDQFAVGTPISQSQLSKGDLVFFATSQGKKITHVGIYTGDGKFIHAPGKDKRIRIDSLTNGYFKTHYMGARTYLD